MTKILRLLLLISVLLAVGCNSAETTTAPQIAQATATSEPTEVSPTATPLPEPTPTSTFATLSQEDKDAALFEAVRDDDAAQVADLLTAGADVNTIDTSIGFTPIFIATVRNNPETFALLNDAGADLSLLDKQNNNLLHHVAASGDVAIATMILERGETDLEQHRRKWSLTPLHVAATEGQTAVAELLVAYGADLESHDEAQDTPLNMAAWQGQLATIQKLVELGAQPIVANDKGHTGIDHANNYNQPETAAYLESLQDAPNAND